MLVIGIVRNVTLNQSGFIIIVYVMLAEFFEYEGLLIALKLKGLLDTGQYIVVGVDTKVYDASDPQKYIEGKHVLIHRYVSPSNKNLINSSLLLRTSQWIHETNRFI